MILWRSVVQNGVNELCMSPGKKNYSHVNYPYEYSIKKVTTAKVTGQFIYNDKTYSIWYEKPLSDFDKTWNTLKKRFIYISILTSFIMTILLWLVLQRLFKPIRIRMI